MTARSSVWRERCAAFVARKEAKARSASLLPFTTAADHGTEAFDRIDDAWASRFFDGPFYLSKRSADQLPTLARVKRHYYGGHGNEHEGHGFFLVKKRQ